MKVARVVLASGLLGLAMMPALGQHIYKYRMPDGTILYTDSQSGYTDQYTRGKLAETLTEPTPAPAEVEDAMRARRETRDKNASNASAAQSTGVDAAYAMMNQARQALQAGLEPLPGERLGNVDGGTRLSPAYWTLVQGLRLSVNGAHDRLDRATNSWERVR